MNGFVRVGQPICEIATPPPAGVLMSEGDSGAVQSTLRQMPRARIATASAWRRAPIERRGPT